MDQFKTRILNTNLLAKYSDKPLLIFYVKVESLVVVQLLKTLDDYEFHFELTFPMGDSLVDSLDAAIQKVIGHKDFNRRAKVLMIMDDYYLTMNRFSIPESQLSQIDQMLEMEIDHLEDYEYAVSFAVSEIKSNQTVFVYMIKKNNLMAIENVFRKHRLFIRQLVTRYHSFQALLKSGFFKIDPARLSILIDISSTRASLFILFNNNIKVYRRMRLKLIEMSKNPVKQLNTILSDMRSFIESSVESYLMKSPNQSFDAIYIYSDALDVSKAIKKASVGKIPVKTVPINFEPKSNVSLSDGLSFYNVYGMYLMVKNRDKFNLIPFMKRFEKMAVRGILALFSVSLIFILTTNAYSYFKLNKSYLGYSANQSSEKKEQASKKRDMVELRDRIKKQKLIIDYSDLTSESLVAQIPLDDFLFNITSISTPDISFSVLRIRRKKVFISGTSSSLNGNYSFYMFLQQLESLPYLGRVKYNLGISGGLDLSSFSIDVDWIKKK
tara:strand:- start:1669 stop:3156 length:1488 start_codon:yes stop_codon:yes gene_type:complete